MKKWGAGILGIAIVLGLCFFLYRSNLVLKQQALKNFDQSMQDLLQASKLCLVELKTKNVFQETKAAVLSCLTKGNAQAPWVIQVKTFVRDHKVHLSSLDNAELFFQREPLLSCLQDSLVKIDARHAVDEEFAPGPRLSETDSFEVRKRMGDSPFEDVSSSTCGFSEGQTLQAPAALDAFLWKDQPHVLGQDVVKDQISLHLRSCSTKLPNSMKDVSILERLSLTKMSDWKCVFGPSREKAMEAYGKCICEGLISQKKTAGPAKAKFVVLDENGSEVDLPQHLSQSVEAKESFWFYHSTRLNPGLYLFPSAER